MSSRILANLKMETKEKPNDIEEYKTLCKI
jgi:hypothetical protein